MGEDDTYTVWGFGRAGQRLQPERRPDRVAGERSGARHAGPQPRRQLHLHPRRRTTSARTASSTAPPTRWRLSGEATVSLTVWGMDDPIELIAPGPQTTAEDTSLTFSAANGNAITIVDIESPRVLVALLVQDGILTLQNTAGLEFPYPDSVNNSHVDHLLRRQPGRGERRPGRAGLHAQPELQRPDLLQRHGPGRDLHLLPRAGLRQTLPITVTPVNDARLRRRLLRVVRGLDLTVYGYGRPGQRLRRGVGHALGGPGERSGARHADPQPQRQLHLHARPELQRPGQLHLPRHRLRRPQRGGHRLAQRSGRWTIPIQVAVPGPQTIAEDTSLTFSAANGNAITITDIESPRGAGGPVRAGRHPDPAEHRRAGVPRPGEHQQQPVDHLLRRQPGRGERRPGRAGLHARLRTSTARSTSTSWSATRSSFPSP